MLRPSLWCGTVLLVVAPSARSFVQQPPPAVSPTPVWAGAYTRAQAERGKNAYFDHCARCHGEDVTTSRNPLGGDRFLDSWEERTLADLFRRMRDTMPPGAASVTVTDRDKIDVLAFVLQQNGFPEGTAELTTDERALAAFQIVRKAGPGPLRSGTMVRAAGCLDQENERGWRLTDASVPERASLDRAPQAGREPPVGVPGRTITLLNPYPSPAAHRGHWMMATGLLIRSADGDAINIVSLDMLSQNCPR
jgi:quinoprotein glucose dehydrogenase